MQVCDLPASTWKPCPPFPRLLLEPTLGPNDTYECWHLPQEDVPGKEVRMQGLEGTYPFCKNAVTQGTLLGGFRVQVGSEFRALALWTLSSWEERVTMECCHVWALSL